MSVFLPQIKRTTLEAVVASGDDERLYDLLCTPLHEALYEKQDFSFMDQLSPGQQLLLSYDYLRNQVLQGGFIQFLVNGYVALLPDMPEWLDMVSAGDMAIVLDDVLKVYVLNVQLFDREIGTKEFAELYDELKEFEILDERFTSLNDATVRTMMQYVRTHLDEYAVQI